MMQTVVAQRIAERAHDVLLADHLGKITRAPLSGEDLVGHAGLDIRGYGSGSLTECCGRMHRT